MTRRLSTLCQNVDLNWLKVSHLNSVLHSEKPPKSAVPDFCLSGRCAVVLFIEKKCLTHLWLFQAEKLRFHTSKSISILGFTVISKREVKYLSDFIAKKMQIRNKLPSLCPNAG